ncbi:putative RNA-directed DNA polymerase [Arabidopsis thaliana]
MFIPDVVQGNQVGFIKGRLLCENVLLASELVENFHLAGHFQGKKGIRQGDPMSSHLFVLIMDILAKSLDKGTLTNLFQLHPKCLVLMVTHLSFADDVPVFFDGSDSSLEGILCILDEFKQGSSLGINRHKTSLLLDEANFERTSELAARFGIDHGSQPLLDKIFYRFTSWTARHLSFAGRLQLLKSVIYSSINLWASVFILPNKCLLKLEQMCNAFLWKGAPNSSRGAKIAWDIVCSEKCCGGLGLRRLTTWNTVLGLKLIWLLFSAGGSLWVSWMRYNVLGQRNFWTLNSTTSDSWIWRRLCKLREVARPFVVCDVGSGVTAKFWHDNWTGHGPLIDLVGPLGPQTVGLPIDAVVTDALRNRSWWIESSRSRSPIINQLRNLLPVAEGLIDCQHDDSFIWKMDLHAPSNIFSAAKTWLALHPQNHIVPWYKAVWFKNHVPKHAFICWVVAWNRLHTRDRLRSWGLSIPTVCLLCNSHDESRAHLFFECPFCGAVWRFFTGRANLFPPAQLMYCLIWLLNPSRDKNTTLIIRLAFQASVYAIWRERNLCLHTGVARVFDSVLKDIQLTIRARLDPISRITELHPSAPSVLRTWFSLFQS